MQPPVVFISYSHDSQPHKDWVLKLATDLRNNGVDATLDQWDLSPGQDKSAFMQRGIAESDRVVLVCSENYVQKTEGRIGGVGYERLIVTSEIVQDIDTKKFIPVVRNNNSERKTPVFLGPRLYIDFNNDANYQMKLEELLREIHGAPATVKPPLGQNPFSGSISPSKATSRLAGPTGLMEGGQSVLDDHWFQNQASIANEGLAKIGLKGRMELRFALHDTITKTQMELLNEVSKSQIHTFGWPIGVILGNRDEYRPRPLNDGIRAEVVINERALSGLPSYDYWALRVNGDFYLLQSLFEDGRDEQTKNKIFFNTRIVRVTEALLFASNLYENLGVAPETKLSIRIAHKGLAGRELTSSNPFNRSVSPAQAIEDESQAHLVETIGQLRPRLTQNVMRITEPLFMLFDFKRFREDVYEDIVSKFVKGQVT